MNHKIIIQEQHWSKVKSHLHDNKREHCAFFFATPIKTKNGFRFLVNDVHIVSDQNFIPQKYSYVIQDQELQKIIKKAKSINSVLIDLHNHPHSTCPTFSYIDISSRENNLAYFNRHLKEKIFGSIVIGTNDNIDSIFWINYKKIQIDRVFVHGKKMHFIVPTNASSSKLDDNEVAIFDRQIQDCGEKFQKILKSLRIAIVGLGGTGSFIATQLAYLGIRDFIIIDNDNVQKTNLNRMVGSNKLDIGNSKTNVIGRNIKFISNGDSKIDMFNEDVVTKNAFESLLTSDFIFLCSNTKRSRAFVNDLSKAYMIPVMDGMTGINKDFVGSRLTFIRPNSRCLVCLDNLGTNEGIYQDDEPMPSVIHLNGLITSLMVLNFHRYVMGKDISLEPILFDARYNKLYIEKNIINKDCLSCSYVSNPIKANIQNRYNLK